MSDEDGQIILDHRATVDFRVYGTVKWYPINPILLPFSYVIIFMTCFLYLSRIRHLYYLMCILL